MSNNHAPVSASAADRWLNCPPSVRLGELVEETYSDYAAEGTLAHAIAEQKIIPYYKANSKRSCTAKLKELRKDPLYQQEMEACTDAYVDYIKKTATSFRIQPYMFSEYRVSFPEYVPEGFGTSDFIMVSGDTLVIVDYKHGKGVPVTAENNPQLKLYALGALNDFQMLYPIKNIRLVIIQPRLNNTSEWEIGVEDLLEWGETVKPIAKLAYEGKGEFKPGEHCRFCKVKGSCRARADEFDMLSTFGAPQPATLNPEEVGYYLEIAKNLKKWADDIEDYAFNQALAGNRIPGYKLVEGRAVRQFTSQDEAFDKLIEFGYPETMLYENKPYSLSALEKNIGKKDFNEIMKEFITTPKGKPALVPESDKRTEYVPGVTTKEAFANNI